MASISYYSKSFLHNHSNLVDFLSASAIIIVCLVILMPKVHESFEPHEDDFLIGDDDIIANQSGAQVPLQPLPQQPVNPPHSHHHHNLLPIGEVLICFGFFVFYCIGLGLSRDRHGRDSTLWSSGQAPVVCCSSTRCPSERQDRSTMETDDTFRETEPLTGDNSDKIDINEDCVMLLNRHHNHHTHSRHHEHGSTSGHTHGHSRISQSKQTVRSRSDYGSTSKIMAHDEQHLPPKSRPPQHSTPKPATTIYVDQIRIISLPPEDEYKGCLGWPLSAKMTLFSLVLAASLILFDMNVLGLIKTIRVFRAAATGALLYVAFFIILPRGSAGCKPCKEEEDHRHV